jgi:hypothetical protein
MGVKGQSLMDHQAQILFYLFAPMTLKLSRLSGCTNLQMMISGVPFLSMPASGRIWRHATLVPCSAPTELKPDDQHQQPWSVANVAAYSRRRIYSEDYSAKPNITRLRACRRPALVIATYLSQSIRKFPWD